MRQLIVILALLGGASIQSAVAAPSSTQGVCDTSDPFCAMVVGIPRGEGRFIKKLSGNQVEINCLGNEDPIVELQAGELTTTGQMSWQIAMCQGDSGPAASQCQALPTIVMNAKRVDTGGNVNYYAVQQFVKVDVSGYAGKFKSCNPNAYQE